MENQDFKTPLEIPKGTQWLENANSLLGLALQTEKLYILDV